ncbi:MAG: hypothetical protein OEV85_10555 [Candidatus Thorarchaeota archaeon]|nr:hypothetical protein [Candidatus Thorarchaeota archaeon]
MVIHQRSANIIVVVTLLILVSNIAILTNRVESQTTDGFGEKEFNRIADVSPSIYDWGITGRANESAAFTVWANVTDDDLDLANVSVHVDGPNTTIHELMPFNGTFYVTNLDALHNFGLYDIYVTATDLANNTREGRHISVEIIPDTTEPPDPSITMPIVVISSVITGFIVCVVAYLYAKRKLTNTA